MAAVVLDGNAVAGEIVAALRPHIDALTKQGRPPRLAAVRANDNKASAFYANIQKKWCEENGVAYLLEELGADASDATILSAIQKHNADPKTSAILLHTPLPAGADAAALTRAIRPEKDAEGMHPQNLGRLLFDPDPVPGPCTAVGAVKLALRACPQMRGKDAVVVGHSQIVGRPAALLLLAQNASVSVAHIYTRDLARVTRGAEILIVATGAAGYRYAAYEKALAAHKKGKGQRPAPCDLSYLIRADMVKKGAVVIDVGVNRVPRALDAGGEPARNPRTGRPELLTVGDVDFENVKEVASAITSPRGGTGPMTNAILLRNTVLAARALD
ncbi:MAG: bifunctional 5,10-methylenetetrahydrofolate dehydrogenase/5,10-methenyltetrahydrofolate cyclohydrolase [Planctomycetota bacterium]